MSGNAEQYLRRWLAEFVVGLDLCPFARPLLESPALRIAIREETDPEALRRAYLEELDLLQGSYEQNIATTLLAFTNALGNFDDFLDFLNEAEHLLEDAGLGGHIQLASFHPAYQFAGEPPDAASHFSNRAPYPVLHLLRENMMGRLVETHPDPAGIPRQNIARLNDMGREELEQRWSALFLE